MKPSARFAQITKNMPKDVVYKWSYDPRSGIFRLFDDRFRERIHARNVWEMNQLDKQLRAADIVTDGKSAAHEAFIRQIN